MNKYILNQIFALYFVVVSCFKIMNNNGGNFWKKKHKHCLHSSSYHRLWQTGNSPGYNVSHWQIDHMTGVPSVLVFQTVWASYPSTSNSIWHCDYFLPSLYTICFCFSKTWLIVMQFTECYFIIIPLFRDICHLFSFTNL